MRLIDELKDKSKYPDMADDKGVVNSQTGSSLTLNQSGHVTVASSKNVQYKMNYASGVAREISFESKTITNRKELKTDEILVNNHKLNPQLHELTNMKQLYDDPTYAIGNLTVNATVLVKAWEPSLKKWVLIRRPMRTPLFYNDLGIARVPEDLNIDDNITKEINMIDGSEDKEE